MFDVPILILAFNRVEHIKKLLIRLKNIQATKLYVVVDGPRELHPDDLVKCQQVRLEFDSINWGCEVHKIYREQNEGPGDGIINAINWFFSREEMGIILEDDCIPSKSFFPYCKELLIRCKDDARISMISGRTDVDDPGYEFSYKYTFGNTWGWATWRRSWGDLSEFPGNFYSKEKMNIFLSEMKGFEVLTDDILNGCRSALEGSTRAWDYAWAYTRIVNKKIGIIPKVNLIENVGVGDVNATHTSHLNSSYVSGASEIKIPLLHDLNVELNRRQVLKESRYVVLGSAPILFVGFHWPKIYVAYRSTRRALKKLFDN